MVVFTEIGSQIECVQGVSVIVVFTADVETFVLAQFSGSGKQTVVGSYILTVFAIWLYGSHGILLLSIQIQPNLAESEMLEIERITFQMAVKRSIADQSDDDARG